MYKRLTVFLFTTACFALIPKSLAETATPPSKVEQKPRLILPPSVVFQDDGKILFQLVAPNANQARLLINTDGAGIREMTKNEKGVWQVSVESLSPGTYTYEFELDGAWIADPTNSQPMIGHSSIRSSLLEVRGAGTELHSFQDVAHGSVRIGYYRSEILGNMLRRYRVYTPPGYDQFAEKSYPVLFLLHGSKGSDQTYTEMVRINWVCDNLIAAGKMVPMILVMPSGSHLETIEPFPRDTQFPPDLPSDKLFLGPYDKNNRLMVDSFVKELLPVIRSSYRTKSGRENLAVSGMSMGGDQSIHAGVVYPEFFSDVIPLAPGAYLRDDLYSTGLYQKIWADGMASKNAPRWRVVAAEKDDYIENVRNRFLPQITAAGIDCPLILVSGAHNYQTARNMLIEHVFPFLFQGKPDRGSAGE